jgi:hypothetical protein
MVSCASSLINSWLVVDDDKLIKCIPWSSISSHNLGEFLYM